MLCIRVRVLVVFSLLAGTTCLSAQSNDFIDSLLASKEVSIGKAAQLALSAAGLVPEDASQDQALALIREKGWKIPTDSPDAAIRLGQYSFLLMSAFEMHGGIMYRLAPGPRYATRQLSYLRIIQARPVPGRTVNGEEMVRILGNLMDWKGGRS